MSENILSAADLPSLQDQQRLRDLMNSISMEMKQKDLESVVIWSNRKFGFMILHHDLAWTIMSSTGVRLKQYFSCFDLIVQLFILCNPKYRGRKICQEIEKAFQWQMKATFQTLLLALEHRKI